MDEKDNYIEQLEAEVNNKSAQNAQLNNSLQQNMFQEKDGNLIEYQLGFDDMLNRLEHFLRGNVLKVDQEGNEFYEKPTMEVPDLDKNKKQKTNKKGLMFKTVVAEDLILFNEYGVNSLMQIISGYLFKNTVLSRYDDMRINEILADLGDEVSIFIYCNYERMGMTTKFKESRFILLVLQMLHIIESAYRRALGGTASHQINTTSIFTQNEGLRPNGTMNPMVKPRFNLLKKSTW